MFAKFSYNPITLCTKCAQGFISNGSTGCVEDCTDGVKIAGKCTKTGSSCSGNWREATEAEICSFLASGQFSYTGAKASSGNIVTTCAGIGMYANGSNCSLYHPRQAGECADYVCEARFYYVYYQYVCNTCPASGMYRPKEYCTPGETDCYEEQHTACSGGGHYECSYYRYSEQPEYTENKTAIQFNCIAVSSRTYVAGSTSNKVCIKN